jgi:excisionase family DNA binding protein
MLSVEMDANMLIAQIESLEKALKIKSEVPIRQRVKRWRNVGWHPQRILDELKAQATMLQTKAFEKEARKRKRGEDDSDSPRFPLKTSQAAKKLGVHPDTVRRCLKKLKIISDETPGGHFRINCEVFKQLESEFKKSSRYR